MKKKEGKYVMIYFIFRQFLKGQGQKYTKIERKKYNEKLKMKSKKDTKKEQNKVVKIY